MQSILKSFSNPDRSFRGCPFWSWNGKLEEERILEQLATFAAMGFGGAMPHTRLGLRDEYLGERFMECIRFSHQAASELGLLLPLYDEDQWPSGHAGGLVTKNPAFRQKECLFLPDGTLPDPGAEAVGKPGPATLLCRWALTRDAHGCLLSWRRLQEGESPAPGETAWSAWTRTVTRKWGLGGYTRVDALCPAAMHRFVEVTHETYKRVLGDAFGGSVPFIFSDEPQIGHHGRLVSRDSLAGSSEGASDLGASRVALPWTGDLPETWRADFGRDLLDDLPAIMWDSADGRSATARWRWFDHLGKRFAQTWAGIPAAWGEANTLPLAGHMCGENDLVSSTLIDADIMRALAPLQMPSVDLLCDWWEPNTLKQATSLANQYGRERVATELYGVNRWDWPLIAHRRQGDWQYALGANLRVIHLAWYSMAGPAKRDYPQPIDFHSPWSPLYKNIEDHFARLGAVLAHGQPLIKIAVVHPCESAWIEMGPVAEHAAAVLRREQRFAELPDWLLGGLLDFDYLSESLLPDLVGQAADGALPVGRMNYRVIILPDLATIRPSTLDACEKLHAAGGTVLVMGDAPSLLAGSPDGRPARICERFTRIAWDRSALLAALEPFCEVHCAEASSGAFPWLVHQMRDVGENRVLFVCNRSMDQDAADLANSTLRVRGDWNATRLDTRTGAIDNLDTAYRDGWTSLPIDLPRNGSLLLHLSPSAAGQRSLPAFGKSDATLTQLLRLDEPVSCRLDEPNALLLDHGSWRLDEGPWQEADDWLILDKDLRSQLNLPPAEAQPYLLPDEPARHRVSLRMRFSAETSVPSPRFLCEQQPAALRLDGNPIAVTPAGWWVDRDLRCWQLPTLAPGDHEIEVTLGIANRSFLEWCYLLGDFSVHLEGRHAILRPPVTRLCWGDITRQGLPFYAGNIDYLATIEHPGGPLKLQVPLFNGAGVRVSLGDKTLGDLLEAGDHAAIPSLPPGRHELRFTWFGTRCNAFGALHNADPNHRMEVPHSWFTYGARFRRNYLLQPQGILDAPMAIQSPPNPNQPT